MKEKNFEPPILFFDGVCNLCNSSIQWILPRDERKIFRYASLQSERGKRLKEKFPSLKKIDSMILLEKNRIYIKSEAALRVARGLCWPWKALSLFIILPPEVRDFFYDYIASHRYRWFGKREVCWVPAPPWKEFFLG